MKCKVMLFGFLRSALIPYMQTTQPSTAGCLTPRTMKLISMTMKLISMTMALVSTVTANIEVNNHTL